MLGIFKTSESKTDKILFLEAQELAQTSYDKGFYNGSVHAMEQIKKILDPKSFEILVDSLIQLAVEEQSNDK